jgi:hypothetical protein
MSQDYKMYPYPRVVQFLHLSFISRRNWRRTGTLPKPLQCTVRYEHALYNTFREGSETRATHNADTRLTEVGRKELRELHDIL